MIPQNTIDQIIETAQVDEVIGEFITLKKRGVNMIGLCPFHNEKTPSFTVSPSKGIYKCFGCGNAGNSVKFLMEHEHYTYPEALRFLANKYNIEVEEEQRDEASLEEEKLRDSLYIINEFAQKQYTNNLIENEEGKSIGLSYFKERGFRQDIIEKFQLGYAVQRSTDLLEKAKAKGYQVDLLKKLGLVTEKGNDFFRERVIFPIRNLSGKVIAFGARTLKSDKKIPKYLNSPETDVYNKSKVLYGAFLAKGPMRNQDECYLVEGYTDVISLHQGGIENVVASSGTSLTPDQIRLIKRYTKNITVLFDGDQAGVKAAFRGIELILEEGLNVKVVLFPDSEDPDSYLRKIGSESFKVFLAEEAKDFVLFKTQLLFQESKNDPVKKANLIQEIVTTIAKIPEPIKQSLYTKECSTSMDVNEQMLINEVNKIKRTTLQKKLKIDEANTPKIDGITTEDHSQKELNANEVDVDYQEKDILRLLLAYGDKEIEEGITVTQYILTELQEVGLETKLYKEILAEVNTTFQKEKKVLDNSYFLNHPNNNIAKLAIEFASSPYELSENWEKMHEILITEADSNYKKDIKSGIMRFKLKKVNKLIAENRIRLKELKPDDDYMTILKVNKKLEEMRNQICDILGTVVY